MPLSESPLVVALDFSSEAGAVTLVDRLRDTPVGFFKVGSELFTACGPRVVADLVERGLRVFLDLKFHDIPNTVAGAAAAAARLKASLLTVHASGGVAMMRAAAEAVRELSPDTRVLAVTVLTSLAQQDLARAGLQASPREQVLLLAELADEAGVDGLVASPEETEELRRHFPRPFLLVAPGIRPSWAAAQDQKRVATPSAALAAGADLIVVGRPISHAPDPAEAARRILEEVRRFSRVR